MTVDALTFKQLHSPRLHDLAKPENEQIQDKTEVIHHNKHTQRTENTISNTKEKNDYSSGHTEIVFGIGQIQENQ